MRGANFSPSKWFFFATEKRLLTEICRFVASTPSAPLETWDFILITNKILSISPIVRDAKVQLKPTGIRACVEGLTGEHWSP